MLAYSALLGLGLGAGAPWWLFRMGTTARYREGLGERLGRVPDRLRATVRGRRVVWVHAVSVGEVLAVSRLVAELEGTLQRERSEASWLVAISTTTRTGQALARERFGAERVFYLPLDFAWAVRAYLRVLRPELVVLTESELWPRLLHECARGGVPVAVVNARVSDRSFRRAKRVRRLWGRLLGKATLFLAQSEEDAARLRSLGAPDGAVAVSGNLKYDVRDGAESAMGGRIRSLLPSARLVIAGSTLPGEETAVLSAWETVHRAVPEAVLLLAPRHPERFAEVWRLVREAGWLSLRCSELPVFFTVADSQDPEAGSGAVDSYAGADRLDRASSSPVLLLDTIGDLATLYRQAEVAFVGGSLVPRGGHNPLEPARFGVPVVMGPSFENFRDAVQHLVTADGVRIVKSAEDLASTLLGLLTNPERAHSLGERGQTVFRREGGATARSVQLLMPLIRSSDRVEPRGTEAVTGDPGAPA